MAKIKAIALALILLWSGSITTPGSASPDEVKWSRVNIPLDGGPGNWVLASGSDVRHLTMAIDGTLYSYANPSRTSYTLFKSTDGGYSWSYTGKVEDTIVDIATSPDDANVIYYATASDVYKSTDAGNNFSPLTANPGGAGSNNIGITSIDVTQLGENIIAVGTRDTDNSQFGGVYILDENKPFSGWTDTNIGNYDVYAVAFSPNFTTDRQLVAVITDETNTIVTTKFGGSDWGTTIGDAKLDKDNSGIPTAIAVDTSAVIAFPDDYSSDLDTGVYVQFVAIDAGGNNGDVYMVVGREAPGSSVATDLNIGSADGLSNIDVTGLAITGNATEANLLAGAANSAEVYFSPDGGINWTRSAKPPTGQSKTYVLMASDFSSHGKAYAATSGTSSAFSISRDNGVTWNQAGFRDTDISDIVDLAPSPGYSQDATLFMLTWSGEHSLWRSLNNGTTWDRVFSSTLANVDSIDLVELSPQYYDSKVVFIAGTSNGNPAIWKSTDNGQNFIRRSAPSPIKIWAVVDDTTLFIGSYDGSNGLVYHTTNGGLSYSTPAVAGNQSLNSIVLSPDYKQDETILVGNTNGWAYWSDDNGTSFEPLPADAISPPLTGSITVAFDPKFSSNHTIYAASDTADAGIYRFIIGKSDTWESIDSTLPSGGMLGQLVVSADGTLYATNFKADAGMERCLNPTYPLGPTFETVTRGLDDDATLTGLWRQDNQLWSIDTTNTNLMTFTDSLTLPVTLTSPSNNAPGIGTIIDNTISNVSLDWETLGGATSYKWQLDHDTDFSTVPEGFEGNTKASSARLPALESATTYYWRVRAAEPVLSPWSAKWSFTTSLGTEAIAPQLISPEASATGVPPKPVFQWSAIAGADSYELLVSTGVSFANPSILKSGDYALPATAWQSDISLDYDTTYYWKVRAISSDSRSAWSEVSAFITMAPASSEAAPAPPPPPAQPTTPDWVKWLMYLGGALLLAIVLLLVTILAVVIRRS